MEISTFYNQRKWRFEMRQEGKSKAAQIMIDAVLDNGGTVLKCTADRTLKMKKYGHCLGIEPIKPGAHADWYSYDEWCPAYDELDLTF